MTEAIDAVFDLGSVTPVDTLEVAVPNPRTGKPTTWVWTIAGPAHPATIAAQEASHAAQVARLASQRQKVKSAVDAGHPVPTFPETLEQIRDDSVSVLAPRVLGWTPVALNGATLDYSPTAVSDLLRDQRYTWVWLWLRERLAVSADFFPQQPNPSGDTQNGSSGSDGAESPVAQPTVNA